MDPLSFFVGGLTLGFVNAIGPRIVQRLLPTPFDQAQIVSIETQRQRLLDEEKRFDRQMIEARERLVEELQHRKDMLELQEQLRRWQFDFLPKAFLQASGSAGGRALNIILRMSDHRRQSSADDRSVDLLKDAVMAAEEQLTALYSSERLFPRSHEVSPKNGVLFYPHYRLERELPVQSAVTTLSSLLASEPVLLVDIAIRDGLRYRVTLAHWGDAMGDQPQPVLLPSQTLDLSGMASDPERAGSTLSLTLIALLVALSDNFHLLRHLSAMPQPAMPGLMAFVKKTPHADINWNGLYPIYARTLDTLGDRAPSIAAEMSASLAIATRDSENPIAQQMLERAVRHYAKAHKQPFDLQRTLDRLSISSFSGEHPFLLQALQQVGGLKPNPEHSLRTKQEAYALLTGSRKRDA